MRVKKRKQVVVLTHPLSVRTLLSSLPTTSSFLLNPAPPPPICGSLPRFLAPPSCLAVVKVEMTKGAGAGGSRGASSNGGGGGGRGDADNLAAVEDGLGHNAGEEKNPCRVGAGGGGGDEKKRRSPSCSASGTAEVRRGGGSGTGGASPPCCQAENCAADLTDAKRYHRRHKVCEDHAKAATVIVSGLRQRFCQQCSRFHELSEFDEAKRSCRRRLAGHNERRRKSSSEPQGEGSDGCRQVDQSGRAPMTTLSRNSAYKHFQIR